MMALFNKLVLLLVGATGCLGAFGQKRITNGPVYVDDMGVMRWTTNNQEAAFFGINYTAPFAYAYRAMKRSGIDVTKAIDQDVYHFSRLGLNAFRVHVWDTEISDSLGNLLQNDHLRLFDYLLAKLRERKIYTLITPIAFWGNGWPEKDECTPGFSRVYGKGQATVNEKAVRAQERYIHQLFEHVNPYTGLRYGDDPFIIGAELTNEPSHPQPEVVTSYIDRLVNVLRNTGWTKPVFYNISQNPPLAAKVAAARVDGFTFQWYPLNLVANHRIEGNYLPHVDQYTIPYDTISAFHKKALLIYEFDPADQLQPIYYPAMARSFRKAGFQWATQFAYDPMVLAHTNSEYGTHYLNLAYTPAKAISLLIAAEAFRKIARGRDFGKYPADTVFDHVVLSYSRQTSVFNDGNKLYYSGNTEIIPLNVKALQHVAGTGSSSIVQYAGSGAYFLDRLASGKWRLEVMPDVKLLADPFAKHAPGDTVAAVSWNEQHMKVDLAELGKTFWIKGLNKGNRYRVRASEGKFLLGPGTYLLSKDESDGLADPTFFAPPGMGGDRPAYNFLADENHEILLSSQKPSSASFYPEWDKDISIRFPTPAQPSWAMEYTPGKRPNNAEGMGLQIILPHGIRCSTTKQLNLRARALHGPVILEVIVIDLDGQPYKSQVTLGEEMKTVSIPLDSLKAGKGLLLPRPYPAFMPLWFAPDVPIHLHPDRLEKLQLFSPFPSGVSVGAMGWEVEYIEMY
ncbi:hypothetical protein SAMN05216436_11339 [bacterium A37T11]|nr:hypothetical protein SAMN05216436_11339 [bacterium A37T11]